MATGVCVLSATKNRSLNGLTVRLYLPGCLLPTVFLWLGVSMSADAQTPSVRIGNLSPTAINEGSTGTYDVWLSVAPTADVTITPTSQNTDMATVSPATLTFTSTSWNENSKQTVTVTAVDNDIDDRAPGGGFGRTKITHTVAGGNYDGVTASDVSVATLTNEVRDIVYQHSYGEEVFIRSAIGLWEGSSSSYSISLATQPWGDTTVTLTSDDPELVTVNTTTLKFTTTNWNVPQPVSITVADNDVDEQSNLPRRAQVKIRAALSGSESDYNGQPVRPFTVNVFDNDIDVTVTPTELTLKEGESDSYTVTLNSEPYVTSSYDYVLDVAASNRNVTVSPQSLTFTESDWNLPQTVQVTAAAAGSTTISLASTDRQRVSYLRVAVTVSGSPSVNFSVEEIVRLIEQLTETYPAVSLSVSPNPVVEGSPITVTATLSEESENSVTIPLNLTAGAADTSDYGSLESISIDTGAKTGTGTITTTDDGVVEVDETFTVALGELPWSVREGEVLSLDVTITDDDGSAAVTIADARAAEGDRITFTAAVDKAVQGGFTITPSFVDGTATFGADYAGNVSAVSFVGSAGETQSFTVTTTEDAVVEGEESFTVSLTVTDTVAPVTATDTGAGTILDNDGSAAVTIADARAAEGDRITFTAAVDKAVQGGFTITPSFVDGTATFGADYAGNVSAVSFAGSAGETQSFTVTTTDDAVVEEEETFTVSLAVSDTIAPVAAANTGMGTIADDDTARRMGLERLLANVGSLALTSAVDTIDARFSVDDVGASSVNLAGMLLTFDDLGPQTKFHRNGFGTPGFREVERRQRAGAARRNDLSLDEFLLGSAFTWSLDGSDPGSAEGSASGAWDRPQWAVWGRGDTQSFDTAPEAGTTYDGELRTAYLGIDTRANRWLAGAALAHSWSDSNYQLSGSGADFNHGRLETMLTAVHPYARWTPSKRTDGWAMLGIGSGEAAHIPDNAESRREKSDLSMRMGAMGLRHTLASVAGGIDMALRADGGAVRLETDDGDRAVNGLSVDSWRVRLGLEVSRPWRIAEETLVLTPFVEAALRADGGDGMVGSGFEVASGVSYSASRIAIELRGRALILQASDFAEDYKERGASLAVVVRPREDGLGFSLTLGPRWGASTRSTGMLWQDAMPRGFGGPAQAQAGYDARLGYGLFSMAAGGLVTPFVEFGDASGREYAKVGARLQLSRPGTRGFQLDAGVSAEFNEFHGMARPTTGRTWTNEIPWTEPADRRLILDLQMRF